MTNIVSPLILSAENFTEPDQKTDYGQGRCGKYHHHSKLLKIAGHLTCTPHRCKDRTAVTARKEQMQFI